MDSGEEILPFEMGYLPECFQKKAEIELNESPENIQRGLKLLREMTERDKLFDGLIFKDHNFMCFLRNKKFDPDVTFSCLKRLFTLMKNQPEMFSDIKFESILAGPRNNSFTFLPRRCPEGCAILRIELDRWDTKETSVEDVKRLVLISLWESLYDPMTQVNGFKVICNVKVSNPLHYLRFCTPSNIYMLYYGAIVSCPGRFKALHIVSDSLAFKISWMILKQIMSDKMKKRFIFHSAPETLSEYFPRCVLPVMYGGDLEDAEISRCMLEWLRKVTKPNVLMDFQDVST